MSGKVILNRLGWLVLSLGSAIGAWGAASLGPTCSPGGRPCRVGERLLVFAIYLALSTGLAVSASIATGHQAPKKRIVQILCALVMSFCAVAVLLYLWFMAYPPSI